MASHSARTATYWILGIIVLCAVGFGGYKLWNHYNKGTMMQPSTASPTQQSAAPGAGNSGSGLPNKTDTSNQQLDQDLQNVQNSMNQLNQDQGTANNDVNTQSQDIPQQ